MPEDAAAGLEVETLDRCPNCQSRETVEWTKAHDRLLGRSAATFVYSRCHGCGILFQSRRPAESAISLFYPDDYAPYAGADRSPSRWKVIDHAALWATSKALSTTAFEIRMKEFYAALDRKPTVLDFGCGSGKFIDQARERGCETVGMDFSPVALAHVSSRGHRALSISDLDWQAIADGSIGLIRMNHVVEHLYDPRRVLVLLFQKLAPDGVIHIATPNSDSVGAERYREHWFSLDCPRHIMIFNPKSLSKLAQDCGFQSIEILHEPLTKDLVRSHLYREVDEGKLDRKEVVAAHGDGILALKFVREARRATQLRRCDRIHLIARKR